jgi:hypothetical protein
MRSCCLSLLLLLLLLQDPMTQQQMLGMMPMGMMGHDQMQVRLRVEHERCGAEVFLGTCTAAAAADAGHDTCQLS